MKRISEIAITRRVGRPYRGADGLLYYEYLDYTERYKPNVENDVLRFWAKLIDLLPFLIPVYGYLVRVGLSIDIFGLEVVAVAISVSMVIIYGSVMEYYFGTTPGKWLLGLCVINDLGTKPNFRLSLKRNILCLGNLAKNPILSLFSYPWWSATGRVKRGTMSFNNDVCTTYVVEIKKLKEIRERLK
ncbi:RDD family protein [Pedobacter sp. SYSU D00535]|uniref:RDD family protein n=1 Tax=Pedobacter sp. SYSU D00535 TaxID=2810308 RepID=UPI001A9734D5|nr:RDD family protein [Pedobacter sp. SYSU D00535]